HHQPWRRAADGHLRAAGRHVRQQRGRLRAGGARLGHGGRGQAVPRRHGGGARGVPRRPRRIVRRRGARLQGRGAGPAAHVGPRPGGGGAAAA
ncbi:unnamed protein product, partial [Prorocentrum cordatum]